LEKRLEPLLGGKVKFYKPSNGLRSKGDIFRAGGVYIPRWLREKKGGPETTGPDWI